MKAGLSSTAIVVLLILAVVALIIGAYVLLSLGETEYEGNIEDRMCKQTNQIRNIFTIPILGEVRTGALLPKSPKVCITQYEAIDASDYTKCDVDPARINTVDGLRECASHQIAQLAWRCWWMSGEGKWSRPGSWKCFTGKIVMNQYEAEDSYIEIRNEFKTQLKEELKCYSKERLTNTVSECETLATYIVDRLVNKTAYNGLIDFYKEVDEEGYSEKITDAENEIEKLDSEINSALQLNLKDPSAQIELKEATIEISRTLPDIGSISEEQIKRALKTKNILTNDEPYIYRFPSNDFQFVKLAGENFEINPNSLFELGFCDPPMEMGDPISEINCNLLTDQHVQLGPGGTVGASREGSPICNRFNAFNKLPFMSDMQKYCEISTN